MKPRMATSDDAALIARAYNQGIEDRKATLSEVGIYKNHGQLDGVWRDVVIVEKLIEANLKG